MNVYQYQRHLLLLLLLPLVLVGAATALQAQTTVEVSPDVVQASAGANVSISVLINNVEDLHTAIIGVTFDKSVVQYIGSAAGSLLSSNASGFSIFYYESRKPAATPDTVRIDQAILGKASVDGSGDVFTLTFKALREGVSHVTITTIELRNSGNYLIPAEQVDGTIVVGQTGNKSPEISTEPPERALLAGQFSYALKATDPDGDPLTYRMTEGPDFLSIDERSGVLTGVPDRTGRFPVSLRVHDGKGGTAIQSFRLFVSRTEHPPSIPVQLSPPNGAKLLSTVDTLRWSSCSDPNPDDILKYSVRIRSGAFDTLITGLSETWLAIEEGVLEETRIYSWTVNVTDGYDTVATEEVFTFQTPFLTSVRQTAALPQGIDLRAPYPNPFRAQTVLTLQMCQTQNILIAVYDINGREVRTLVYGELQAGEHMIHWDGRDANGGSMPSGMYLLVLTAHDQRILHNVMLMK